MSFVKIICGAYGYKNPLNRRIEPKMHGEIAEVSDEEAERLVSLGAAEHIKAEPRSVTEEDTKTETVNNKASKKKPLPKIKAASPVV